jgi:hypothetical protein
MSQEIAARKEWVRSPGCPIRPHEVWTSFFTKCTIMIYYYEIWEIIHFERATPCQNISWLPYEPADYDGIMGSSPSLDVRTIQWDYSSNTALERNEKTNTMIKTNTIVVYFLLMLSGFTARIHLWPSLVRRCQSMYLPREGMMIS